MQVSSVNSDRTNSPVIIGSNYSQEFGIASSAEFFSILSKSLYTNPLLAVIRETICNAWDAHIASNNTNKPIEITLTDNELIIKDFGNGIAPEKMQPIYCVYGASTKANDEELTGGFGLGCKAPFAYTDAFTVESCYKGTQTIYNLAKSNDISLGKPTLNKIASLPTEDTGLKVIIPINVNDKKVFLHNLKNIVLFGNIKAKLNNNKLPTFRWYKDQFLAITNIAPYAGNSPYANVFIQYGNVVYCVDHKSFKDDDNYIILQKFRKISNCSELDNINFVLRAEPNSIDLVPSRESLHYSEKTTNSIKNLLDKAVKFILAIRSQHNSEIIQNRAKTVCKQHLRKGNSSIFASIDSSFLNGYSYKYNPYRSDAKPYITTHYRAICYQLMMNQLFTSMDNTTPYWKRLKKEILLATFDSFYQRYEKNPNGIYLKNLSKHYKNFKYNNSRYFDFNIEQKLKYANRDFNNIFKIIYRKIQVLNKLIEPITKKDNFDLFQFLNLTYPTESYTTKKLLLSESYTRAFNALQLFDLIANSVVITNSMAKLKKNPFNNNMGTHLVIHIRSKKQIDKIKEVFLKNGIPFIDKCFEPEKRTNNNTNTGSNALTSTTIARKKGIFYSLSNFSGIDIWRDYDFNFHNCITRNEYEVIDPKYIIKLNKTTIKEIASFTRERYFLEKFIEENGNKTIAVNSAAEYQKAIETYDLIDFNTAYESWFCNTIVNTPAFIKKSAPYYLYLKAFHNLNKITVEDKENFHSFLDFDSDIDSYASSIMSKIYEDGLFAQALNLPKNICEFNHYRQREYFGDYDYRIINIIENNDFIHNYWNNLHSQQTKIPKQIKKLVRKLVTPQHNNNIVALQNKKFLLGVFNKTISMTYLSSNYYLDKLSKEETKKAISYIRLSMQYALRRNYDE